LYNYILYETISSLSLLKLSQLFIISYVRISQILSTLERAILHFSHTKPTFKKKLGIWQTHIKTTYTFYSVSSLPTADSVFTVLTEIEFESSATLARFRVPLQDSSSLSVMRRPVT